MSEAESSPDGRCPCGSVSFRITGKPLLRAFCHCNTCREFNGTDVADVTVFRAADVTVENESGVDYRAYQRPALARRGKCTSCDRPAVERASIPFGLDIVILPSGNVLRDALLPAPSMHIFYDRRVADASDGLPKRGGFVASQTSFMLELFRGLRRASRARAPG